MNCPTITVELLSSDAHYDGKNANIRQIYAYCAAVTSTRTWAEWLDGWVGDPAFILRYFSVLTPFVLRSAFAYCPLIVHRLSIDCPSFRWRNNVESMDWNWSKNECRTKAERRQNEGKTNDGRKLNEGRTNEQRIKIEKTEGTYNIELIKLKLET